MAIILAIETSGASCSVALKYGDEVLQRLEDSPREHARKVLPMIDGLMAEAGVSLHNIDALAFTRGPGSFTGLRIGFGIVQGLAFGCDLPVIGISSLQGLAYRAGTDLAIVDGVIVPALDARMREVYWGIYRYPFEGLPEHEIQESADNPETVSSLLPDRIDVAVGDGWQYINHDGLNISHFVDDLELDAKTVVSMAETIFEKRGGDDISDVELSYVRSEISWKKRERIRSGS